MVEQCTNTGDFFLEYRSDPVVPSLKYLSELIEKNFTDKSAYINLKPHLIEWMVIRVKHFNREISTDELNELTRKFSDGHDELFDNSLFVSSIKLITEKIGLAT